MASTECTVSASLALQENIFLGKSKDPVCYDPYVTPVIEDCCSTCNIQSADCQSGALDSLIPAPLFLIDQYIRIYKEHLSGDQRIISGGVQQYINKSRSETSINMANTDNQVCNEEVSDELNFCDLPDSVQLRIFSFLDSRDLCRSSRTCQSWCNLAQDNILWQQRLEADMKTWSTIGHSTNPQMYRECQSDYSYKEIYLRCSPEVNKLNKLTNSHFHQLSSVLRSLWPKKTPKLAMFGPGLETSTRSLVRRILEDTSGLFKTTGMFPGQFEGVGSGFTMKMNDTTTFNLVTLYTATKEERENRKLGERRLRGNRLLAQQQNLEAGDEEDEEEEKYEIRQAVKDLSRTLQGYIFVVDADTESEPVCNGRAELFAMVDEAWASSNVPVVVLSCVSDRNRNRVPCIDVAAQLRLQKLNRPWQVFDCIVDEMNGIIEAIDWVVETSQRN